MTFVDLRKMQLHDIWTEVKYVSGQQERERKKKNGGTSSCVSHDDDDDDDDDDGLHYRYTSIFLCKPVDTRLHHDL